MPAKVCSKIGVVGLTGLSILGAVEALESMLMDTSFSVIFLLSNDIGFEFPSLKSVVVAPGLLF